MRLRREEVIANLDAATQTIRRLIDENENHAFDYAERSQISIEAQQTLHACSEIYRLPFFHDPDVQRSYHALVDEYWRAWENVVPPGFWDEYDRLKRGDLLGLETAISFLEADPWFFRSGYLKADLLRFVARLTPAVSRTLKR